MSEKEHAQIVLAAILPNRKDLLEYALVRLNSEHFENPYKNIFKMLEKYHGVSKGILSRQGVEDILKRSGIDDFGIILSYTETYDALVERTAAEEDFKWSVDVLKDLLARKSTEEALLEGIRITKEGIKTARGEELKGHEDARSTILERFSVIESQYTTEEIPDGDVREEKDEILAEYAKAKAAKESGEVIGLLTGIPSIDEVLGGFQPGELDLIIGNSSSGKSSLCVQTAWWGAIQQSKNIVFVTSETLRPQIRRKIVARHSKLPIFNYPQGLDTKDLKFGTLTKEEETVLANVLEDMTYNSNYGKLEVVQIARGATVLTFESILKRYQDSYNVDACIMDYLALLRAPRKRNSNWEEKSDTMKEAKNIAATFDNGRGISIISPWQVTKEQKELADKLGFYTTLAVAETREATNSGDVIMALLEPPQLSRYTKLSGSIIKNRDGAQTGAIEINVDYATSCFTDATSTPQSSAQVDILNSFMGM